MYELSQRISKDQLDNTLKHELNYTAHADYYFKTSRNKYIQVSFKDAGNLTKVVVHVYEDASKTTLQAQYESRYLWKN